MAVCICTPYNMHAYILDDGDDDDNIGCPFSP